MKVITKDAKQAENTRGGGGLGNLTEEKKKITSPDLKAGSSG
jgi:hypothetical protein